MNDRTCRIPKARTLLRWVFTIWCLLGPLGAAALAAPDTPGGGAVPPQSSADQGGAPTPGVIPVAQGRDSPRATVTSFLSAINRVDQRSDAWREAERCLDLSLVNRERAPELASRLLGVLNRLGRIDPDSIPNRLDAQKLGLTSYTLFPRARVHDWVWTDASPEGSVILVADADGRWLFSAQTMAGIDRLYESIKDLPIRYGVDERRLSLPLWIEGLVPASLATEQFLSIKYWQWLGLAVLAMLGVALDQAARLLLRTLSDRLIARQQGSADPRSVLGAARPLGLLAAGVFWLTFLRVLGLPDGALTILLAAARVFCILAGTWAAWKLTDLICEVLAGKAARTASKFDDVLIPLVRKTIKVLIVAFGLIYAAGALNISVLPMLTSLGIGGLAFAFAAKDTVENFFGSVAVLLDRPFEVGDWVVVGDVEGTVEEVGFRSTRVRTFYNSQVTVPNATLVRATVDNYGRRRYRRLKTHVGIQYDTPAEKIIAFTEGIRELVRAHPYTRKDYYHVRLHQFSPYSLDVLVYVFHEVPDWQTELRERERLFLDVIRLADQLGVQFAFPTQTIHLHQAQAGVPHSPAGPPGPGTDREAGRGGVETARRLVKDQPWMAARPGPVTFSAPTDDLGREEGS